MIAKLFATLAVAAMAVSIAGSSAALNPQPLPPKCVPGARCPPRQPGGPIRYTHARHGCMVRHHHRICGHKHGHRK